MMKLYTIICFFIVFTVWFDLFPQVEEEETGGWMLELFLGFENVPNNANHYFDLTAQSTVWECPLNYPWADSFNISSDQSIYSSRYLWNINDTAMQFWLGWNIVYSNNDFVDATPSFPPYYGYGLYKISTTASNSCFYIDYRDDRIKPYQQPYVGHNIDLWIKYDYSNHKFYYYSGVTTPFIEIANHSVLRFWDIKEKGLPTTSEFPDFWVNSLVLLNDGSNHPKLVWSAHPENNIEGYKIFKRKSQSEFTEIATTQYDNLEYVDYDEVLPSYNPNTPIVDVEYKVYGVLTNSALTDASNTVSTYVVGNPYKVSSGTVENEDVLDFELFQNYPNPFNPSTRIDYFLNNTNYVTISITNVFGEEIESLINHVQQPGRHSVYIDLAKFSSGVYLYTLKTNSTHISKKMLFIK